MSNEYFDITVEKLYFGLFRISIDGNLRSRSSLCLLKIHNYHCLKINVFAEVDFRSNKTVRDPLVLQVSVWEVSQQFLCRKSGIFSLLMANVSRNYK